MAIKGGNLFFQQINVTPSVVKVGEQIDVDVTVANGALAISPPSEPDACGADESPCEPTGLLETEGYCYEVEITPSWGFPEHVQGCVQIVLDGVGTATIERRYVAPEVREPFDAEIEFVLRGASGEDPQEETVTRTVTVEPPSNGNGPPDEGCSGDGDCPEGQECRNGECVKLVAGFPIEQVVVVGGGVALGALMVGASALRDRE